VAIHAICVVKNEADIIETTLRKAAEWCDHIFVYDNGSVDGTWEIVNSLSRELSQVRPFKQDARRFTDTIRLEPYRRMKRCARRGDWWCRLDADEIYIDNPAEFLAQVPAENEVVWSASFQYYFTDLDLERFERDPSAHGDAVALEERCRYYKNNWSEARFFRHRRLWGWNEFSAGRFGRPHRRRIRLKHYQYRSPRQIQQRLSTRSLAIAAGVFPHESRRNWAESLLHAAATDFGAEAGAAPTSWKQRVAPASDLVFDDGSGDYVIDEAALPGLPDVKDGLFRPLAIATYGVRAPLRRLAGGLRRGRDAPR
jgi:hypothetical protein